MNERQFELHIRSKPAGKPASATSLLPPLTPECDTPPPGTVHCHISVSFRVQTSHVRISWALASLYLVHNNPDHLSDEILNHSSLSSLAEEMWMGGMNGTRGLGRKGLGGEDVTDGGLMLRLVEMLGNNVVDDLLCR